MFIMPKVWRTVLKRKGQVLYSFLSAFVGRTDFFRGEQALLVLFGRESLWKELTNRITKIKLWKDDGLRAKDIKDAFKRNGCDQSTDQDIIFSYVFLISDHSERLPIKVYMWPCLGNSFQDIESVCHSRHRSLGNSKRWISLLAASALRIQSWKNLLLFWMQNPPSICELTLVVNLKFWQMRICKTSCNQSPKPYWQQV